MSSSSRPPQLPDRSISALVADAHVPTRIGLGVLLRREPWVARCLLAAEREESVALARIHQPDVAILDISDVGPFAASVTARMHTAHPTIQIILSSRCGTSLSTTPQAVGAVAFLPSETTSKEIVDTIRTALLARDAPEPPPAQEPVTGLTDRERRVLILLSTGATNREIGAQLHLGPDSIKKHATALYRKLGVRNRTEAAQRAAGLAGLTNSLSR